MSKLCRNRSDEPQGTDSRKSKGTDHIALRDFRRAIGEFGAPEASLHVARP